MSADISTEQVFEDDAVISFDITNGVLLDSVTTMSHSVTQPDLIQSVDDGNEDDPTKLTLAYERLYEVPRTIVDKFSNHIVYLDISHNKITNLDVLVHFKHLTSLIADDNPITENCFLPPMPQLQLLWLNRCRVSALHPWAGRLRACCPALRVLSLMANPAAPSYLTGGTFYEYLQYRLFIIAQFPALEHLDDRRVTADQRAEAQRLYRRPLLERLAPAGALGALGAMLAGPVAWGRGGGEPRRRNLPI